MYDQAANLILIRKRALTMFHSKMMTVLTLVLVGVLFAACKTGTATPPPKIFTTDAYQPLNLNARRLEIIDNWQMPVADPYIGHRVSPLPSTILADWVSHVLRAAGGSGIATAFDIPVRTFDAPEFRFDAPEFRFDATEFRFDATEFRFVTAVVGGE